MKKLAISQRVDEIPDYGERRDALDQRWYALASELQATPIPMPNIDEENALRYLSIIKPDAVILSGGNTLLAQARDAGDVAPERDSFETFVLQWALSNKVPLLGVCRGMQFINHFFGGSSCQLTKHVGTRHSISFCGSLSGDATRDVNSYHGWGIRPEHLGEQLDVLAHADDGTVEAFEHTMHGVAGIMWHPEREQPFAKVDIALIGQLLKL